MRHHQPIYKSSTLASFIVPPLHHLIFVAPTRFELVISDSKSDVLTNYTIEQEKHDTVSQRRHGDYKIKNFPALREVLKY